MGEYVALFLPKHLQTTAGSYLSINISQSCRDVHKFNSSEWCKFVKDTDSCAITDGIFDYTHFVYCSFHGDNIYVALMILISWLIFLFIAMGVCADDYFCPPLVAIAKLLKMSDNVAGVTLLAFGNGAADVFSSIAAVKTAQNGDIGLAIGALLGAGILLATVIAGTICIVTPCHMAERPFLRDVSFFLLSVFMVFYILFDRKVTLFESIAFLMTYLIYSAIVIIGRWIYQKLNKRNELRDPVYENESSIIENQIDDVNPSEANLETQSIETNEETPLLPAAANPTLTAFQEFVIVISPINMSEFKRAKCYLKIYLIVRAPIMCFLNIAVPIVDYQKPKNGWNRHLNSFHCTITPLITILIADSNAFNYYLGGKFPVYALIIILGVIFSVTVYSTSKNNVPPKYHIMFAFLGFISAVIWTDAIATEIVNLLTTIGILLNISNVILGLTLLAWGNSVADFIADVVMAKKGYPRAALSACYGGPLFNILLGIGVPFTIAAASSGTQIIKLTLIQVILASSLLLILAITLVVVPMLKFIVGKGFGLFLFIFYGLFLLLIILAECDIFKANF